MAVVVQSCCCGCSLKTGVLVLAFLSLIGGGYNIHSSFSSASEFSRGSYGGLSPPSAEHLQEFEMTIMITKDLMISLIIFIAISWAFSIYFLIVVYSFHEALREDPSGVTAGFLVNNPTGSAPNANYAV
ncbi:uncharacterized protein [Acropora muricata]|uniref:uncharacterized protein isoform X4 n=1 Tax=Acropora muricata TaxID=159855 RepID=UPI0034E4F48D